MRSMLLAVALLVSGSIPITASADVARGLYDGGVTGAAVDRESPPRPKALSTDVLGEVGCPGVGSTNPVFAKGSGASSGSPGSSGSRGSSGSQGSGGSSVSKGSSPSHGAGGFQGSNGEGGFRRSSGQNGANSTDLPVPNTPRVLPSSPQTPRISAPSGADAR